MMALAFAYILVLYWTLLGLGLVNILGLRTHLHLRLLVAASVGLAVNLIALFYLSRFGFAIGQVAVPLFIAGLAPAVYVGVKKRRLVFRSAFYAQQLLVLAAMLPFAWPFMKFGFEWLAYVNGDMSYYSLSASRFLDYGYAELPADGNIYNPRDHSLAYWFFPNILGHRAGADMLLAQAMAVSGLTAHQIFMPLIVACQAVVVMGAGALTLFGARQWGAALWAMALVAFSPMLSLEVTKQLLAQATGLGVLAAASVAYVMAMRASGGIAWGVIVITLSGALMISYSEVLPFFALYVLAIEALRWRAWRVREARRQYLRILGILLLGIAVLMNGYLLEVARFVWLATSGSFKSGAMTMQTEGLSLFPHLLVPAGIGMFAGWAPFGVQASSVAILAGILVIIGLLGILPYASWRGMPSAVMASIMALMAAYMYIGGNAFGLFKLSMFGQPFVLSTVVAVMALYTGRVVLKRMVFALWGISLVPALTQNVMSAVADIGQALVPYASTEKLGAQLRGIRDFLKGRDGVHIFSDTPLREMFLLESLYFKGMYFDTLSLPTQDRAIAEKYGEKADQGGFKRPWPVENADHMFYYDPGVAGAKAKFTASTDRGNQANGYLLTTSREFSPINHYNRPPGKRLELIPYKSIRNHLVFKQSTLGSSYISSNWADGGVGLWMAEPDPFNQGQTMAAVGRYNLYEVVGAEAGSRPVLEITSSVSRDEGFRLPHVRVVGENAAALPLVGRGSARVIGTSVSPQVIAGGGYLGVDYGRDGAWFTVPRAGLNAIYGTDIKLDIRKVVSFVRDISYISPAQYASIRRPTQILLPAALRDSRLEYSGIFEDGWLSEESYAVLSTPSAEKPVVLKLVGEIPFIGNSEFKSDISIRVNGDVVYQAAHGVGNINLAIAIPPSKLKAADKAVVQILSSGVQQLPNGDGRPVSVYLKSLGFY